MKYNFIKPEDYEVKQKKYFVFYQLTLFKHPKTNKHHIRKFVLDDDYNFVDVKEYYITKEQYDKFIKTHPYNKYKQYQVYTLDNIEYPNMSDILTCQSDILHNKSNDQFYTNFAPIM